jgi:hypothetical protein
MSTHEGASNTESSASLAVVVLVFAALVRRLWVAHESVPFAVGLLWFFGAAAALLFSAVGSQLGRRLAPGTR